MAESSRTPQVAKGWWARHRERRALVRRIDGELRTGQNEIDRQWRSAEQRIATHATLTYVLATIPEGGRSAPVRLPGGTAELTRDDVSSRLASNQRAYRTEVSNLAGSLRNQAMLDARRTAAEGGRAEPNAVETARAEAVGKLASTEMRTYLQYKSIDALDTVKARIDKDAATLANVQRRGSSGEFRLDDGARRIADPKSVQALATANRNGTQAVLAEMQVTKRKVTPLWGRGRDLKGQLRQSGSLRRPLPGTRGHQLPSMTGSLSRRNVRGGRPSRAGTDRTAGR